MKSRDSEYKITMEDLLIRIDNKDKEIKRQEGRFISIRSKIQI